MELMGKIKKITEKLNDTARRGIGTARLDLKRQTYIKQLDRLYAEIGKYIYGIKRNNAQINSEMLESLCVEIDKTRARIKNVDKKITTLKTEKSLSENQENITEGKYTTFHKNANDLKIQRTDSGIQFLKFCPECQSGNDPENNKCIKCGFDFK